MIIRLGDVTVEIFGDDTITVLPGAPPVRTAHEPQPGQHETAAWLGYGTDVRRMNRDDWLWFWCSFAVIGGSTVGLILVSVRGAR